MCVLEDVEVAYGRMYCAGSMWRIQTVVHWAFFGPSSGAVGSSSDGGRGCVSHLTAGGRPHALVARAALASTLHTNHQRRGHMDE